MIEHRIDWYFLLSAQSPDAAQRVLNRIKKQLLFVAITEPKRHHRPENGFWFRATTKLDEATQSEAVLAALRQAHQFHHNWSVTLSEHEDGKWNFWGVSQKPEKTDLKTGIAFIHFEVKNYDGWVDPPIRENVNEVAI